MVVNAMSALSVPTPNSQQPMYVENTCSLAIDNPRHLLEPFKDKNATSVLATPFSANPSSAIPAIHDFHHRDTRPLGKWA
ncbi:hypothetical protein BKA66DRAFT_320376 [Pyrenochaeta sp. MPI-SDFR-AT-0127]|nr:hypothetical protein BKA66DRAFT_320376 [Pyrenochaeta sp. MPI-SDFR-AT-0127]